MEKKINVYAYNKIKSSKLDLNKEQSYVISRIINIENKLASSEINTDQVAFEIHKCFESVDLSFKTDRVCVSYLTPFSNRMNVLSSFNSERVAENTMLPGYNCSIARDSSIFNISDSDIRISNDLEKVILSFQRENHPLQRSLGNLYKMGIRSGMTLSSSNGHLGKGYLFLNTKYPQSFSQLSDGDYLIVCVLKLLLNSVINKFFTQFASIQSPYFETSAKESSFNGIFKMNQLKEFIEDNLLLSSKLNVETNNSTDSNLYFFLQERSLLFVISEILNILQATHVLKQLDVEITRIQQNLTLKFYTGFDFKIKNEEKLKGFEPLFGFKVKINSDSFELSQQVEFASEAEAQSGYSVFT